MVSSRFYTYIATELILGKSSPDLKNFFIYKFNNHIKKIYKGLSVEESLTLDKDGKISVTRTTCFFNETSIRTSHINSSNDVARIITYMNPKENVAISDVLFNEEDFKYNNYIWNKILPAKIECLAILLEAFNTVCMDDIPIVMNDFPNIAETLFILSWILKKNGV